MSEPVQYSDAAWTVANKFSRVLGSETRDLAGWVELALNATRQEERERCARIADEGAYYGTAEGAEDMAKTIANLIRNRTED